MSERPDGQSAAPAVTSTEVDDACELCEAARFTHWYYEDDVCWVADCEACSTPMVVWKPHGTEPSEAEIEWMMSRLADAGDGRFGEGSVAEGKATIDRNMRQIPEHFHAHIRDREWLTRRWNEKLSRYTGVGGERIVGLLAALCALVFVLAACGGGGGDGGGADGGDAPKPPESYPQEVIDLGQEIYRTTCQACHGKDGEGGIGLPLTGIAASKTPEEHRDIVANGEGASMPPFGASLTDEEIDAVVAYERTAFAG